MTSSVRISKKDRMIAEITVYEKYGK